MPIRRKKPKQGSLWQSKSDPSLQLKVLTVTSCIVHWSPWRKKNPSELILSSLMDEFLNQWEPAK